MKNLYLLLLLFFSNVANAETITRIPETLSQNERAILVPESHYRILDISIDKLSLNKIIKTIGSATKYKGTHTANHVCYKNKNQKIEFTISSLGFGYQVFNKHEQASKCGIVTSHFENGFGLKIGVNKSKILSLLGKPTEIREENFIYVYWLQKKPNEETEINLRTTHKISPKIEIWTDIYSIINITFKNNMVNKFSVNTTETY